MIVTGTGRITIDAGEPIEFTDFKINLFPTPVPESADISQRWCRFCGGKFDEPEIWRMSCRNCFDSEYPTVIQMAQLYGQSASFAGKANYLAIASLA